MKKILLSIVFFSSLVVFQVSAQTEKCGTMKTWNEIKAKDINALNRANVFEAFSKSYVAEHLQDFQKNSGASNSRGQRSIISIPVVVHVIHGGEAIGTGPNVSDATVYSQIDALNKDYRLLNDDSLPDTHAFYPITADCEIEFCLAQQDPQGNPTSGIVRVNSGKPYFTDAEADNEDMKNSANGGDNNWDPTKYLNVWTYKTEPSSLALGRAAFPWELSTSPGIDGVICNYTAFGTVGPDLQAGNGLGRTMTHEVGHWLGLYHIWGDGDAINCGNDSIADTPDADSANYGCKTFPWKVGEACTNDPNGQMFMDYMDYSDDPCLVAFTAGQAARMNGSLNGHRSGILSSNGCQTPNAISTLASESNSIHIYPNPSRGDFYIRFEHNAKTDYIQLVLRDEIGLELRNFKIGQTDNYKLDLSDFSSGVYFLETVMKGQRISKKLILAK